MKNVFFQLFFLLIFSSAISQENSKLESVFADPTLNPTASSATLGLFGGDRNKNNTGALSKMISLIQLNQGSIKYSPTVSYYSSGVKVNDWGGRLGLSWSDNFTGVISRQVKGVPDEFLEDHISDIPEDTSQGTYDILNDLWAVKEQGGGYLDSQYDLFSCNIFGYNIEFIIDPNEQIHLLNHQEKSKIEILSTFPFTFKVTKPDGVAYFFGQNNSIEYTQYNRDNACDIDAPPFNNTPTAWFLNKIESPTSDVMYFYYEDISIKYIYDYNESFTLRSQNYPNDELCSGWGFNYGVMSSYQECYRSIDSQTKYLTKVSAGNFEVNFYYTEREDIYNEKLLEKITVNNLLDTQTKQINFEYLRTGNINYTPGFEGIDIRYFLEKINISTTSQNNMVYSFSYYDPASLPARFSKSQDLSGYFNNANNSGPYKSLIPEQYVNSETFSYYTSTIPTGNRKPNSYALKGLLKEVQYPTKGTDQFEYELNSYTVEVENIDNQSKFHIDVAASTFKSGSSPNFTIPYDQEVDFEIYYAYQGNAHLEDNAGEEYYLEYQIWNVTDNSAVIPYNTVMWNQDPTQSIENISVSLISGKTYKIMYNLYGSGSTIDATYSYDTNTGIELVEKDFYGMRIKKIITSPDFGEEPLIKGFNYKQFTFNGDEIIYNNYTSSQIVNLGMNGGYYKMIKEQEICPSNQPGGGTTYGILSFYKFNSHSMYNMNGFNGNPIIYSSITEFNDASETSFLASIYASKQENIATPVYFYGNLYYDFPLENNAWNNGIEVSRYYGALENNSYKLTRREVWNYQSHLENTFENYVVNKSYNQIYPSSYGDGNSLAFDAFAVTKYSNYSYRYNLVSHHITDYLDNGNYETERVFNYNENGIIKTSIKTASDQKKHFTKFYYPDDVISLNSLTAPLTSVQFNAITQLKSDYGYRIKEPIQVEHYIDRNEDSQLTADELLQVFRTEYKLWNNNLTLPSILRMGKTFNNLEKEKEIVQYSSDGKVQQTTNKGGVHTSYLWGYGGNYLVAKIENSNYSEVLSAMGGVFTPGNGGLTANQDNQLRTNLSNSIIISYSYKPLVGLESLTGPKGEKTTYTYDLFNRLKQIKDQDNNLIEEFKYNLKF